MSLLRPVEMVYHLIGRARRALYRRQLLVARRLRRPVISVGNLSMGGTGKTPMVIAVGKELSRRGKKVAVLSRGYGRTHPAEWERVAGEDPERYGDEPVTIARSLPSVEVIVGSDRYLAASGYLAGNDCDVFLLDDGFQHLQLHRDADIVIVDPSARFSREGSSALSDADLVVKRETDPSQPPSQNFACWLEPRGFEWRGSTHGMETLRGKRVAAFSGLANNAQFFAMLARLGANLVHEFSFPDHARYSGDQIAGMKRVAAASGAEFLITTEKDFVKIKDKEIAWISVEMSIAPRDLFFERLDELLKAAERA